MSEEGVGVKFQAYDGKSASWVIFMLKAEVDQVASKEQGKTVYKDVEYANFVSKNGKNSVVKRATDKMKAQHSEAWQFYVDRREHERTHLETIGVLPTQVKELESLGIHSLEDMARAEYVPTALSDFKEVAEKILKLRYRSDKHLENIREGRENLSGNPGKQHNDNRKRSGPVIIGATPQSATPFNFTFETKI